MSLAKCVLIASNIYDVNSHTADYEDRRFDYLIKQLMPLHITTHALNLYERWLCSAKPSISITASKLAVFQLNSLWRSFVLDSL